MQFFLDLLLPHLGFLRFSSSWLYLFCILWIHRYLRLIVHCISHWTYKSIPIPIEPKYTSKDVTVIIPTIHNNFPELIPSLQSILACHPHELVLVTTATKVDALKETVKMLEAVEMPETVKTPWHPNIRVLYTSITNKRLQVCKALPTVKTGITVMADDDVTWPSTTLRWLLAPFEDEKIGGVGTCQKVRRVTGGSLTESVFNWLGAAYIERRNFEISATHNIDGGTSCMSGRTGAYRTEILQSHDFLDGFKTERWGKYIMNADDDNFVTRWLVNHQWKTWIQYERECEVETTLENGPKFLSQCLRWARSNWRSNWTSLVRERYVLTQQPWCTYALHFATFTSLAFVVDPLLLASLWWGTVHWDPLTRQHAFWSQFIFMFAFTKVVKLMGLFLRNPKDVLFLPVSIIFGYMHGFIKVYALFTLHMTSWGSRADGDANDDVRMSPRPKRSASVTTPPSRESGLIRFKDEKNHNQNQPLRGEKQVFYDSIDRIITS